MSRIVIATGASLAAVAVGLAVLVPGLPDPVAIHFGLGGAADGFAARSSLWVIVVGVTAVGAVLPGVLVATTHAHAPAGLEWLMGLPVGLVWAVGATMLATLVPQHGLPDAADAVLPAWAVPVGLGLGVAATILAGRLVEPPDTATTSSPAPRGALRATLPDGPVLWQATTPASRTVGIMGTGLVVAGLVAGVLASWWLGLVLLASSLPVFGASRYAVTIGPKAVRIAGVVVAWPAIEVPLDTVTAATADSIGRWEFGGVGIRVQPGLKTTGIVTRRGPALTLSRTDGSRVKVSLDDPDVAAGVVNTLLDRRGRATAGC